jgi:hypothetical protein
MNSSFNNCVQHLQMHAAAGESQAFLERLIKVYGERFGYDPVKLRVYLRNNVTQH